MQYPSVSTFRPLAACLCAAAALLLCPEAAPAQERIARGSQAVEERIEAHVGTAITVCVEAAAGVSGGKRVVILHDGARLAIATDAAEDASCASLEAGEGDVSVRLEYMRLGLFRSRISVRRYPAAALRGRVLVFRWIRG